MPDDKHTRKAIILEAAARLFRDKGYSATSMRDLARAVDLQASSLYNHISSKEELLQEICFSNAHRFLKGMEEIENRGGSPIQQLRALIELHIDMATRELTSVTAFNDEWRHLSEPYLSEFTGLRREYEHRFRNILEAGMRTGAFRDLHPGVMLHTILSAVRWVYDWYREGKRIQPEELKDQIATLLISGIARM